MPMNQSMNLPMNEDLTPKQEGVSGGANAGLTHEELLEKMRAYLMSDLYLELSDRYISLDETEPKAYGYTRDNTFIEGQEYPAGALVSYNFISSEVKLEKAPEELIRDRKSYYLR